MLLYQLTIIVSECVIVVKRHMDNCFSNIMARTSYFQWNEDEVRFVLDQQLRWIFIVLVHWNNSLNQLGHIVLIPRQPFFAISP